MIAVDTNIIVYAHREQMPSHEKALSVLTKLAEGHRPWGIPVFCAGEFVRVVTHVKLWQQPSSPLQATETIESLIESPSCEILMPGPVYLKKFLEILKSDRVIGNLSFDAQIAALCSEHGVSELITEDRDFLKFKKLNILSLDEAVKNLKI